MKYEEIIKALECCSDELHCCSICPQYLHDKDNDYCSEDLHMQALDLINLQQEEIENLKVENQSLRNAANSYKMHYEETQTEIERLKTENNRNFDKWIILDERTKKRYAELYQEAKSVVRAEAIKEFAERLKQLERFTGSDKYWIDNLVKEMVESE